MAITDRKDTMGSEAAYRRPTGAQVANAVMSATIGTHELARVPVAIATVAGGLDIEQLTAQRLLHVWVARQMSSQLNSGPTS